MCTIAYHASHEQFTPSELVRYSILAQQAGFGAVHSSDHFQPWSEAQGESGHAFTWLGAAMQVSSLPFGIICAPGPRHHPVILAQAVATLSELYPNRLWVALGSGEAINERVIGEPWPNKVTRNERLSEAFQIMTQLLEGVEITHHGHFKVEKARLYTLPTHRPRLFGAALSEDTAHWLGSRAEGLLTINHPVSKLGNIIDAFREGGGEGKPIYIKVQLSYAREERIARQEAFEQWRTNIFDSQVLTELWAPGQFETIARFVTPEDVERSVNCSNDLSQHVEWLKIYRSLGADCLILHNVNRRQEEFIRDFGQSVIPNV